MNRWSNGSKNPNCSLHNEKHFLRLCNSTSTYTRILYNSNKSKNLFDPTTRYTTDHKTKNKKNNVKSACASTHGLHFRGGELALDDGVLVALLDVDHLVAVEGDDALDLAAVRGLLVEFLAEPEFDLGVLEGALGLHRVLAVVLRHLDDGTHAGAHLTGDHADTCSKRKRNIKFFVENNENNSLFLMSNDVGYNTVTNSHRYMINPCSRWRNVICTKVYKFARGKFSRGYKYLIILMQILCQNILRKKHCKCESGYLSKRN